MPVYGGKTSIWCSFRRVANGDAVFSDYYYYSTHEIGLKLGLFCPRISSFGRHKMCDTPRFKSRTRIAQQVAAAKLSFFGEFTWKRSMRYFAPLRRFWCMNGRVVNPVALIAEALGFESDRCHFFHIAQIGAFSWWEEFALMALGKRRRAVTGGRRENLHCEDKIHASQVGLQCEGPTFDASRRHFFHIATIGAISWWEEFALKGRSGSAVELTLERGGKIRVVRTKIRVSQVDLQCEGPTFDSSSCFLFLQKARIGAFSWWEEFALKGAGKVQ